MRLVVCFLSLLTVLGPAESGNVLIWYTEGSHWINLRIVLETLIDRGHNVTVLVPNISLYMKAKESDRFFYQPFNVSMDEQEVRDFIEEFVYFSVYETDQLNVLQILMKVYKFGSVIQDMNLLHCDGILKSPELMVNCGMDTLTLFWQTRSSRAVILCLKSWRFPWCSRSALLSARVVRSQLHLHLFLQQWVNSRTRWASQSESSICCFTFLKMFFQFWAWKDLTSTTLNI